MALSGAPINQTNTRASNSLHVGSNLRPLTARQSPRRLHCPHARQQISAGQDEQFIGLSLQEPAGSKSSFRAKQRSFWASLFRGLAVLRRPRLFVGNLESCQAKSEPYGAKSAFPRRAGFYLPPPSNSERGCDICLRRSSEANHQQPELS